MYVVPVITGHGSLPALISRLREFHPFFDFFFDTISIFIHNSGCQFFISVLILLFTLHFAYRCLISSFTRFKSYASGESREGLFESILDFFFERCEDNDDYFNDLD